MNAHILQFLNGLTAIFLDDICNSNHAQKFLISCKEKRGLSFFRQTVCHILNIRRDLHSVLNELPVTTGQLSSIQSSSQTISGYCLKLVHRSARQILFFSSLYNGSGQWMFTLLFQIKSRLKQFFFAVSICRNHIRYLRFSTGDRSCLIQCYHIGFSGFFQRYGCLKHNTMSGTHAISYHDRHRSGQSQSTRAADYQNGNTSCQCKSHTLSGQQPDQDRSHCDRNNSRNKDS